MNERRGFWNGKKAAILMVLALSAGFANAQKQASAPEGTQLTVVSTRAVVSAATELATAYQNRNHVQVKVDSGTSEGETGPAIPGRVHRGEQIDVIILVDYSLDALIKEGKVLPDSKVDLVRSQVGIGVKAGSVKPNIGSPEALKQTLLKAKSVAFTTGVSGLFARDVVFPKLGIGEQMKAKSKMEDDAGELVAKGEADLLFQQISELMLMKGIDIVGPLPAGMDPGAIFSAGIPANAPHPKEARALIQYLASPAGYDAIRRSGLEPFKSK